MSFHFVSLKSYCSAEWLDNATLQYRTVFDKAEIDYLRAEVTLANKRIGGRDWDMPVVFKLFDQDWKELTSLEQTVKFYKNEPLAKARDGWGNATKGTYYDEGTYTWVVYHEEKELGRTTCYVNDIGEVTPEENPYFEMKSMQAYKGVYDFDEDNKNFLVQFNKDTTQYAWLQTELINKTDKAWEYEMIFCLTDHKGERKGTTVQYGKVEEGKLNNLYTFDAGWGNMEAGSYKGDYYYWHVHFMGICIATGLMQMGDEDIEGDMDWTEGLGWGDDNSISKNNPTNPNKTTNEIIPLPELLAKLDALIGLQKVKMQVRKHIDYTKFVQLRKSKGLEKDSPFKIHSVFTGNAGTGKTTVVQMLGKIYQSMGLLSKGHVHKVDRAELIGEFIGQTAPKVKKAIEKARGGVLFVDEAYALMRDEDDNKDFGREAVEILMMEMSDGKGDIAIMLAGYPDEMRKFLHINPGLKSRIFHFYHFDDYSENELMEISQKYAGDQDLTFDNDAIRQLRKVIQEGLFQKDKSFGNARFAQKIIDEAKIEMASRIMQHENPQDLTNEEISMFLRRDFFQD